MAAVVKNPPVKKRDTNDPGSTPELRNPLEQEMATHSSLLPWKIPCTEEPGRIQSMGSQNTGHN